MRRDQHAYELIHYLVNHASEQPENERLPSLKDLSQELGVSVATLREQMEVARALGFVEARPRTGIRRLPYSFLPAAKASLAYAMALDQKYFEDFSRLRNHLEAAYWFEAAQTLTAQDLAELKELVKKAWVKLALPRIQTPHDEHKQLHLTIFRRLENRFVLGILETYWQAYESIGLNLYAGFEYLQQVWGYHQLIVEAIDTGDLQRGYQALVEHSNLIMRRPLSVVDQQSADEDNEVSRGNSLME